MCLETHVCQQRAWSPGVQERNPDNGKVTFKIAPGETPLNEEDNVSIRYCKTNTEYLDILNNCTISTVFGYNGNDDRIFITGNKNFKNMVWYSYSNDVT